QLDYVALIRRGIPRASFDKTTAALSLTLEEASASLKLPKRTLARRKQGHLDPQQSERLVRLAIVGAHAHEVFGDASKAHRWLRTPSRALGGQTPLSLLDTDIGAQAVEDELVRIEYGVYI